MGVGAMAVAGGAAVIAYASSRSAMCEAERAYDRVAARTREAPPRFQLTQVADLPEIAQRYFRHAIAPGTPLYSVAELQMMGTFLLGDRTGFQSYAMTARQVLRPPNEFVWMSRLRSGALSITGSDALVDGEAWTRFWLLGLVPVAQESSSPDLVRSAQFRSAVESALSLPASLLPENGVKWEQVSQDVAEVTLQRFRPAIVLRLTLAPSGAVREVIGQRWSNANPEKTFTLQPFGGTMSSDATFQGFTIPTYIEAGNHYGTDDYLPFFQATITSATYR